MQHGRGAADRRLPSGPPLAVLVAGPTGFVRTAVRDALEGEGITVVGDPAPFVDVAAVAALQPDVVLADIDAIGRGWAEQVRDVRSVAPRVLVVILAAGGRREDIVEAIQSGAAGYITKDITGEALARAIAGTARGELAMSRVTAAIALGALQAGGAAANAKGERLAALTPRELEVLAMVAQGMTDPAIAARMSLSVRTVESHVAEIRRRLGVRTRTQAAAEFHRAAMPEAPGSPEG